MNQVKIHNDEGEKEKAVRSLLLEVKHNESMLIED